MSIKKSFTASSVQRSAILFLTVFVVLMALHAMSLRYYPPVFVDEAIIISRVWTWLHTGLNFGSLEAGVFEKRFDGFWTFAPLIPTWFYAVFVHMFGLDLSLLRLASLLCGIGLLGAVFSASYQLSGSYRCASAAIFLVASSSSFLISAHYVRYDIIVAALSFTAIAVYLAATRRNSVLLGIVSGVLLGLAFEVHVNAAIYGPIIVALSFAEERWRFYRQRVLWGFAGGCTVALAWYLWAHVLQFPEAYFGIGRAMAGTHYPPLLGSPMSFFTAFTDMAHYLIMTQFRLLATLFAGIMLWQGRFAAKSLLMFVVGTVSFAVLIKAKMNYYLILIEPLSDIVLAQWIELFVLQKIRLKYWSLVGRVLTSSVLVASVLFNIANFLVTITFPPPAEARPVAARIERVIPEGGSVMGAQTYWFDLHQYRYIAWQNILAHRMYVPGSTFADAMTALRPDIFILDDHLRQFVLPEEPISTHSVIDRYAWERRLPKPDVEAFLAHRGTLKERVETRNYGTVEIYLLDWEK